MPSTTPKSKRVNTELLRKELQELQDREQGLSESSQGLAGRQSDLTAYGTYFSGVVTEEARADKADVAHWGQVLDYLTEDRLETAKKQAALGVPSSSRA